MSSEVTKVEVTKIYNNKGKRTQIVIGVHLLNNAFTTVFVVVVPWSVFLFQFEFFFEIAVRMIDVKVVLIYFDITESFRYYVLRTRHLAIHFKCMQKCKRNICVYINGIVINKQQIELCSLCDG